ERGGLRFRGALRLGPAGSLLHDQLRPRGGLRPGGCLRLGGGGCRARSLRRRRHARGARGDGSWPGLRGPSPFGWFGGSCAAAAPLRGLRHGAAHDFFTGGLPVQSASSFSASLVSTLSLLAWPAAIACFAVAIASSFLPSFICQRASSVRLA